MGVVILVALATLAFMVLLNVRLPVGSATSDRVDAAVHVQVQVMDLVNHSLVPGATVYLVMCSPNGTSDRDIHETALTGDEGGALFAANYTLEKDQAIYIAASNRKPLVDSDFTGKNFNGSGYLGEWKSFNYSLLHNDLDDEVTISCLINVDLDSGRMV